MTIHAPVETRPIEVEPRTKTVGDVLRHAARIIEERGWHHGSLEDKVSGAVCVWGGIGVAATGRAQGCDSLDNDAFEYLRRWLYQSPVVFNDTPGRTAAEVIAALRAAADEADQ